MLYKLPYKCNTASNSDCATPKLVANMYDTSGVPDTEIHPVSCMRDKPVPLPTSGTLYGEYVTWTFSPNNKGIAHQGRAG